MQVSFFNGFAYKPAGATGWPALPKGDQPGLAAAAFERSLHAFDLADELGFDWLAIPEHHFKPFVSANPTLAAAILSQRQYRAKIAVLGTLLPGRDPVAVAEEYATLDNLTGGKLVIGLLRGNPIEQLTFDLNPQESRARFEEALELVLTAWREPAPFGWEGRYFRRRTLAVWPRLLTPLTADKVVISGNSHASIDLAARLRVAIAIGHATVAEAAQLAQYFRDAAATHGWQAGPEHIVYHAEVHVADTDAQAQDEVATHRLGLLPNPLGGSDAASRTLRAALGEPNAEPVKNVLRFCGGPERLVKEIRAAQQAIGFGTLNAIFQVNRMPEQSGLRSLALFGREIIPGLR